MAANKKRVLSGIQPSGTLHLGNYFGMMKPALELQADPDNQCFYFIADYHALTQIPDPELLRRRGREVALDFLACGLDPERTVLDRGRPGGGDLAADRGEIPGHCDHRLSWQKPS